MGTSRSRNSHSPGIEKTGKSTAKFNNCKMNEIPTRLQIVYLCLLGKTRYPEVPIKGLQRFLHFKRMKMKSKKKIVILLFLFSSWIFIFPAQALRIVSLAPSVTYNLQQMGADSCIVGRTSYCPAPLPPHRSEIVGNVLEINLEKIISLRPDIVFCMAFTQKDIQERLKSLGINVKDFSTPKSFDEICEQALEIGKLSGFEKQAQDLVLHEKAEVERISARFLELSVPANGIDPKDVSLPRRTFFQIGTEPVFPVIKNTFMNQYLEFLGLENIVEEYKGNGITKEYVLKAAPGIMFISKMSGVGQKVVEEWKKFPSIPAVATGRIFLVNDDEACCPTPLFFRKTLQYMAGCLLPLFSSASGSEEASSNTINN